MANMPVPDDVPRMEVTAEKAQEIEAKLAAIASDTPVVEPEPVKAEESPESAVEADPTPVEAAVEENKDAPGSEPEPADKVQSDAPTLPANIRRSLVATGWTEEEIVEQHTALGDAFETIADKVHAKRMDESREWAARGRMVREVEPEEEVAQKEAPSELPMIDVDAIKEKYGHDPDISAIIDEMSKPMNASIEALRSIMPEIAVQRAHQEEATQVAMRNEIESFFSSKELATYGGFYGAGDMDKLPEDGDLFNNRMSVLQYADQLQVGAGYQGRTISLSEALGMAHDAVSGDFRMEALREEIKAKMTQRAKAVTLRPESEGGDATPVAGEPRREKTRAELEAAATVSLRKLFG